jgi:hypothetical protein
LPSKSITEPARQIPLYGEYEVQVARLCRGERLIVTGGREFAIR